MISIRPPRAAERPAIPDLVATAFATDWPRDEGVREAVLDDPDYDLAHAVVAVDEDGKLVGHAAAKPSEVSLGEVRLPVGRLGTVCIHPDYRRRGLGKRLVSAAADLVADRGAVILNPAHDDYVQVFYEQLGFVPAMRTVAAKRLDAIGVNGATDAIFRDAEPGDVEALARLYETHYLNQPGNLSRTVQWWQARVARRKMLWSQVTPVVQVAERDGRVVAYLVEAPNWALRVWEWAVEPGHEDAALALLRLVAVRCAGAVQVAVGPEDPLASLLAQHGAADAGEPPRPVMVRAAEVGVLEPVMADLLGRRGASLSHCDGLVRVHADGARLTCDWSHLLALAYDGRILEGWVAEGRVSAGPTVERALDVFAAVIPARAAGRRLTDAY